MECTHPLLRYLRFRAIVVMVPHAPQQVLRPWIPGHLGRRLPGGIFSATNSLVLCSTRRKHVFWIPRLRKRKSREIFQLRALLLPAHTMRSRSTRLSMGGTLQGICQSHTKTRFLVLFIGGQAHDSMASARGPAFNMSSGFAQMLNSQCCSKCQIRSFLNFCDLASLLTFLNPSHMSMSSNSGDTCTDSFLREGSK